MRLSINEYRGNITQFAATSDALRPSWPDAVGDAFYRDIIEPLKEEAERLEPAMQALPPKLEQLKIQIDAI